MKAWLVYTKEIKTNGRPFPFQHDEITTYYLTDTMKLVRGMESATRFPDHHAAARVAKRNGCAYGKFTLD